MSRLHWTSENEFLLDGTSYVALARLKDLHTAPGQLAIFKGKDFVERYESLVDKNRPRNIFELGIFKGGSTAFLAQIARPDKLVAVDISPDPVPKLEQWIDAHGMRANVSPRYGVDQANHAQLAAIMREEFGDAPLDLVIDDASHLVAETRASFNSLFPLVRPGGIYLIEDW